MLESYFFQAYTRKTVQKAQFGIDTYSIMSPPITITQTAGLASGSVFHYNEQQNTFIATDLR
jgi:hypothetical protein